MEKIKCAWCPVMITTGMSTNDGLVCERCANNAFTCDDCLEVYHLDDSVTIRDTDSCVCEDCFNEGSYGRCDDCDNFLTLDGLSGGLCEDCRDGDFGTEDTIRYRPIDLSTKAFQSEGTGKIITSQRTFGVELEMVNSEVQKLKDLSVLLEKQVGVGNDGSIHGGFGVEVQTPILTGRAGEDMVTRICTKSKECGFTVNKTCGMHCHLGASDFLPAYEKKMLVGSNVRGRMFAYVLYADKVGSGELPPPTRLENIYKLDGVEYGEKIYDNSTIPLSTIKIIKEGEVADIWGTDVYKNAKFAISMLISSGVLRMKDTKFEVVGADKKNVYLVLANEGHSFSNARISDSIIGFYEIVVRDFIERTKALMAFYVIFDDVFLSMISSSRRGNMFCKPIKNGYSLAGITQVRNQNDFDRLWYSTNGVRGTNGGSDRAEIESRKEDHHDSTRYHGVNFHSLLGRNKTLEIRYHGGTLDSKKILHWVSLHQAILDGVASGGITMDKLLQANSKLRLDDKIAEFFKMLQLSDALRTYVTGRLNTYK